MSLLVHEFGHALVARRLRHDPSIMLHGFGGLTARSRRGRDVEEAAIVAMGPAAGLALGLVAFAVLLLLGTFGSSVPIVGTLARHLLYTCIVWNLLNLLPMWPLDGGQLLHLGLGRWLSAGRASRVTHSVSLAMIALLMLYSFSHGMFFYMVVLLMLGMQNIQALQGSAATSEAPVSRTSSMATELVETAAEALKNGEYKDAARRAHQARSQDGVSPAMMERIWEILGLATEQLHEPEEALAYLRRARPNQLVRQATARCLEQLGRHEELAGIEQRWASTAKTVHMRSYLIGALAFIGVAIALVFVSPIFDILF
jgi:Zn-dependent protease